MAALSRVVSSNIVRKAAVGVSGIALGTFAYRKVHQDPEGGKGSRSVHSSDNPFHFRWDQLHNEVARGREILERAAKHTPVLYNREEIEEATEGLPAPAAEQDTSKYNLWSGPKILKRILKLPPETLGEYLAHGSEGFTMDQLEEHFAALQKLREHYPNPHSMPKDPPYHAQFSEWEKQQDALMPSEEKQAKWAQLREEWLRGDGARWMESMQGIGGRLVGELKAIGESELATRFEGKSGFDLSLNLSEAMKDLQQKLDAQGHGDLATALLGLSLYSPRMEGGKEALLFHDRQFHKAWDPTSLEVAVKVAQALIPVESFGLPHHPGPHGTVQLTVEVPKVIEGAQLMVDQVLDYTSAAKKAVQLMETHPEFPLGIKAQEIEDIQQLAEKVQDGIQLYREGALRLNYPENPPEPESDEARDLQEFRSQSAPMMKEGAGRVRANIGELLKVLGNIEMVRKIQYQWDEATKLFD